MLLLCGRYIKAGMILEKCERAGHMNVIYGTRRPWAVGACLSFVHPGVSKVKGETYVE